MIDRFERFSLAISEISRHWHKLTADEMEKYGLKGNHSIYLLALARSENGLNAAQLCEACSRDKADVSRMMSIMEQKGLVRKEGNGYRGVFRLTEDGFAAVSHVKGRVNRAVELVGSGLTEEQRAIFYDALDSIMHNLRKLSQSGIPE